MLNTSINKLEAEIELASCKGSHCKVGGVFIALLCVTQASHEYNILYKEINAAFMDFNKVVKALYNIGHFLKPESRQNIPM